MRLTLTISAALLFGAWLAISGPLVFSQGLLAEDEAAEAPPAVKVKPVLRMVRTKRILTTLEASYEKERGAETPDTAMLDRLEKAMEDAKALLKPIKPEELTESEREDLKKALGADGKNDEADDEPDEDPLAAWQRRALDRAFEGSDLTEDEEAAATPILTDWFTKSWKARTDGDSKLQSDLKRERDKALQNALGKKKARKVINQVNRRGG